MCLAYELMLLRHFAANFELMNFPVMKLGYLMGSILIAVKRRLVKILGEISFSVRNNAQGKVFYPYLSVATLSRSEEKEMRNFPFMKDQGHFKRHGHFKVEREKNPFFLHLC